MQKNGLQVAFKDGAGALEVFFGVGFGGGDFVKGFIEDANDALLFGEVSKRNRKLLKVSQPQGFYGGTDCDPWKVVTHVM